MSTTVSMDIDPVNPTLYSNGESMEMDSINPNLNSPESDKFKFTQIDFANVIDGVICVADATKSAARLLNEFVASSDVLQVSEIAGEVGDGLWLIDGINTFRWWIKGERKSTQHTLGMTCSTARQILSGAEFLGVDLDHISLSIGNIPLIGASLRVVGSAFSLWHEVKQLKKTDRKIQAIVNESDFWKEYKITYLKYYENRVERELEKSQGTLTLEDAQERVIDRALDENDNKLLYGKSYAQKYQYLENKLETKIQPLDQMLKHEKNEKKKSIASIVGAIINIAYGLFVIIAISSGMALAAQGWPLIVLGLVVSGYSLWKFYYQHSFPDAPRSGVAIPFIDEGVRI